MTHLKELLVLLALTSSCVWAEPASDATIKKLFEVSQTRGSVDAVNGQIKSLMDNVMRQASAGTSPTERQKQAMTNFQNKLSALIQQENSWELLEPRYLRMYRETFSEDEMTGMIAFYETPAGQAVIKKMPKLVQQIMVEAQGKVVQLMPKIQVIQKEFIEELKQAGK